MSTAAVRHYTPEPSPLTPGWRSRQRPDEAILEFDSEVGWATDDPKPEEKPSRGSAWILDSINGTSSVPRPRLVAIGLFALVVVGGGLWAARSSSTSQAAVETASGAAGNRNVAFVGTEPAIRPPMPGTGNLSVVSHMPGALVTVDGKRRGPTPLVVNDLPAGRHDVVVRSSDNTYRLSVQVSAGTTASLDIGQPRAQARGAVTVPALLVVQGLENGRIVRIIGTGNKDAAKAR